MILVAAVGPGTYDPGAKDCSACPSKKSRGGRGFIHYSAVPGGTVLLSFPFPALASLRAGLLSFAPAALLGIGSREMRGGAETPGARCLVLGGFNQPPSDGSQEVCMSILVAARGTALTRFELFIRGLGRATACIS